MQSVGGQGATSGVQMLASPPTQSAAGDDASPVESPAVQKGSGPTADPRAESARFPLPPAAQLYAEYFDWPISIVDGEVEVTCGDVLDVTTMPASFAVKVDQLLRVSLLRAPIVELRPDGTGASSQWAFFSQSKLSIYGDEKLARLSDLGVKCFGTGAKFSLPPNPASGTDVLSWLVPPPIRLLKTPLPPWESVISCAFQVQYGLTDY